MATHLRDCPISIGKWDICTCEMYAEEKELVTWTIMKQEGKLKWYNFLIRFAVATAPSIHRLEKAYVCTLDTCINTKHNE